MGNIKVVIKAEFDGADSDEMRQLRFWRKFIR